MHPRHTPKPTTTSERSHRGAAIRAPAARPEAVGALVRTVELLVARGHQPDAIERVIAAWLRDQGRGPNDIPELARRAGLSGASRTSHALVSRIDAIARRPGAGPRDAQPIARSTYGRDPHYFHQLQQRAAGAGWALQALGWTPTATAYPTAARALQPRATNPVGAMVGALQTRMAVTALPGVYAIQRDAAAALGDRPLPSAAEVLARLGPGQPLPAAARRELETELGAQGKSLDLERVRVHDDAAADRLCRELGANAFAIGRHLVFRSGRYAPDTREGLGLIAHELTHVWQQHKGKTAGCDGVVEDGRLEGEARSVGQAVAEPPRAAQTAAAPAQVPNAPRPQATNPRELAAEARRMAAAARLRPSAMFVVGARIEAFDAQGRARGTWDITGPVPLAPGYWLDGRVDVGSWSTLSEAKVAELTGGRADDLWVVGPRRDDAPVASA
ncbi:MAG: DUF4157 domain-containing protein [Myxococcota bacterium]